MVRKKLYGNLENDPLTNMSFDLKLLFVYHIAMMILFSTRPFDDAYGQIVFAVVLGAVLIIVSVIHKIKHNWSWPGLTINMVPGFVLNLLGVYAFMVFSSYSMNSDIPFPEFQLDDLPAFLNETWTLIVKDMFRPFKTTWYLGILGIGLFNILHSLNLASMKKSEFESHCSSRSSLLQDELN